MVAAQVRSAEGDENWILAEVVNFNNTSGRYEVDDIDEEQKERHTLSKRKVIPLPTMRASPETNPEALYEPGTLRNGLEFRHDYCLTFTIYRHCCDGNLSSNDVFL